MIIHTKKIKLQSSGLQPTFHDVTNQVKEAVAKAGVSKGICVIYSRHTTCSIVLQEPSHDVCYTGIENLQQDLCNIMEKLAPTCRYEGQYLHPGPEHISVAEGMDEKACWSLNTEAHLRSVMLGRSESIVIENGEMDLGEFCRIYFVDWDQVRARARICNVQVLGNKI